MSEGLIAQTAVRLSVGALVHLAKRYFAEQIEHLLLLRLILIERLPGIVVNVLQLLGCHVLGLEHHLSGIVVVPVEIEDAALSQQVVVGLGMREGREHGELSQVEVYLAQEVDEPLAVVLGLIVQSEQDGALHSDAVVVVALHTFLDIVAGVIDSLIDIPCTGIVGQLEHLVVVLNGVADPFLLERSNGTKQLFLPLLVLRQ